ncbi:MAG: hypothetical protein H6607_10760 [Flavobacteriales bacterium]|nr:hypothetical protein [Flavobacteriales bacterium]
MNNYIGISNGNRGYFPAKIKKIGNYQVLVEIFKTKEERVFDIHRCHFPWLSSDLFESCGFIPVEGSMELLFIKNDVLIKLAVLPSFEKDEDVRPEEVGIKILYSQFLTEFENKLNMITSKSDIKGWITKIPTFFKELREHGIDVDEEEVMRKYCERQIY